MADLKHLRARIIELQRELDSTKRQLYELETQELKQEQVGVAGSLQQHEYRRYGRQMILDGFGLPCMVCWALAYSGSHLI